MLKSCTACIRSGGSQNPKASKLLTRLPVTSGYLLQLLSLLDDYSTILQVLLHCF